MAVYGRSTQGLSLSASFTHSVLHDNHVPQVDTNKLAALAGYTPASASVIFGKIKTKLRQMGEATAANGPINTTPARNVGSTTNAPKSTGKRGAKTMQGDGEPATPSKRPRKTAPKNAKDDDEDDEFSVGSIKREELMDIQSSMNDFLQQVQDFATGTEQADA